MPLTCARCGSDKVIPAVPLLDHYGDLGFSSDQATVEVRGKPEAWVFKESVFGKLSVRICGECGYAELQVSNCAGLYERYQRSLHPGAASQGTAPDQ